MTQVSRLKLGEQFTRGFQATCEAINSPRSLAVYLLLKHGEIGQLQNVTVNPCNYSDPESFALDNFCSVLLKKLHGLGDPNLLRAAAESEFLRCEAENCKTNARLRRYHDNSLFLEDSRDSLVYNFCKRVKRIISECLGGLPLSLPARMGPGATYNDKGRLTTLPDKFRSRPTITAEAVCLNELLFYDTAWGRFNSLPPEIVRGNRFTTVPKDSRKDRGICIEPSLNVFYQLGIGSLIRDRLFRVGIDLSQGQDHHRELARQASMNGEFSTIDLSSASDTMSLWLIRLLLPSDWLTLLESTRSPTTLFRDKVHFLEKFSSMGNGFTFELETLVFWAIAKALGSDDHLVYGDDIIVRTGFSRDLIASLRFFGFTPNGEKTFVNGNFRESCGGDYFQGVPVRGHYLKSFISEPQHVISALNGIYRFCGVSSRWRFLNPLYKSLLGTLPKNLRACRGPERLGDLVIHSDSYRVIDDYYVFGYTPLVRVLDWAHWDANTVYITALYGADSRGVSPRDDVVGYRVKRVSLLTNDFLPENCYGR